MLKNVRFEKKQLRILNSAGRAKFKTRVIRKVKKKSTIILVRNNENIHSSIINAITFGFAI